MARFWFLAGPASALVGAGVGVIAMRRRPAWVPGVVAVAAAAGWAVIAASGATWRMVVWPRTMVEQLVLPALVLGASAGFGRSRWAGFAGLWFAAWWLAGAGPVGPAFWRVLFGALLVAWVLVRLGGREPERAAACGLSIAGAGLSTGAEAWVGVGLAVAGAALGARLAGRAAMMPAGIGMIAIVGAEIGAGRLLRGGIGVMDYACLGAMGAPGLVPLVARRLDRVGGRRMAWAAPGVVASLVAGAAILAARWR